MAIDLIKNEIRRFLAARDPEVICISGRWGVGKTYAWNHFLLDAQRSKSIALEHYSYVSLFGINSLDDFKFSIFENSVKASVPGAEPSIETAISQGTKKVFAGLQKTAFAQHYVGGLGPLCFFAVKDTIVCVDDIERRGTSLSIRDVLGLVTVLKEQKGCKVVLILNDEATAEKPDFDTYFEKVVDERLTFAPTAAECARIALPEDTVANRLISECCVMLGIQNIRVIKKIQRAVTKVETVLQEFDRQVLGCAVRSLTLLTWSVYEPEVAPPLEYLRKRAPMLFTKTPNEKPPPNEAAWNALLDRYGFFDLGEFDNVLLDGTRKGYFDPELLRHVGADVDKRFKADHSDNLVQKAWDLYHQTFANNQDEVVAAVYRSFLQNLQFIDPINLNGTVWLLKELGHPEKATDIIAHYVDERNGNRQFWDLNSYAFRDRVNDQEVIEAFNNKKATFQSTSDPTAILLSMADTHSWSDEVIQLLSLVSVNQYYDIFKANTGEDLRKLLDACFQFARIAGTSSAMSEITTRAKTALERIGKESRINALRVKKYGVDVGSKTEQIADSGARADSQKPS